MKPITTYFPSTRDSQDHISVNPYLNRNKAMNSYMKSMVLSMTYISSDFDASKILAAQGNLRGVQRCKLGLFMSYNESSGLLGLWKTWKTLKSYGASIWSWITLKTWKSQGISFA